MKIHKDIRRLVIFGRRHVSWFVHMSKKILVTASIRRVALVAKHGQELDIGDLQ